MNASQALSEQRIDEIDTELLQVRQDLQLGSSVDSRVQSFINLESNQKASILAQLTSGEKSEASTEWGFLKNIINIDCFFSSASGNCGRSEYDARDDHTATEAEKAAARRRAEDRLRKAREAARRAREKAARDKAELERLRQLKEQERIKQDQDRRLRDLEDQRRRAREAEERHRRLQDEENRRAARADERRKAAAARAKAEADRLKREQEAAKEAERRAREEELRRQREAERRAKANEKKSKRDEADQAKQAADAAKQAEADRRAEESRRKADELEARRKEEAERAAAAAAEAKRKADEAAAAKRAAEEAERRRQKEEAERKRKEAEAARKAAEEAKRRAEEEARRLKAAAEAAAKAKAEEEARARAAAAAKAARLKKIKDDYKKRRIQFTNVIGTKFFGGNGKAFAKAEKFHILVYYTEAGAKKEEAIYFKESFSFTANNLKQAFLNFASKIRSEIDVMPLREFALIGNRKLLLTTSIFDDFFEKPVAKGENLNDATPYKYSGDEFKDDRISRLFIGFGFQKFLLDWPEKTLDADFEGYQVLQIVGKSGTWTKVGPNYQKAVKVFDEKASQDQAFVILTHTSGKWYKVSGKQNGNSLYLDAYLSLSGYLQSSSHFSGPILSESKVGFRMQWQQDEENKAKFDKLMNFYTGAGDRLYQHRTFYALTYDRRSHQIKALNWKSYLYMKKALQDVARAIYTNVIKPNNNKAYMALVHETGPLYCSEGDMTKKHICQRLIGAALYRGWLLPDEKMMSPFTTEGDRNTYIYVAYLGNSDKQDEAVMKKLHWDYNQAVKIYKDYFNGADAPFDYGIIGHTGKKGWWMPKTLYKGSQDKMDVFRLLALHAQKNLNIYTSEASTEEAAKVVTLKEHEAKMREAFEKLNGLYKGKGEVLYKNYHFFLVGMNPKNNAIGIYDNYNLNNARQGVTRLMQQAFNRFIKSGNRHHFIMGVKETGKVFYCSAEKFDDSVCAIMIGRSLYSRWLTPPKEVVDPLMRRSHKDYMYFAIVQNTLNEDGKGIQEPVRVNLTYDLGESRKAYRALFEKKGDVQKYNIGLISHYGIQFYSDVRTALRGSISNTDVWEMLVDNIVKDDGVFGKAAECNEEALGLITQKVFNEKRAAKMKKIKDLYTGKAPTLYKNYQIAAIGFDKRYKKHFWLGSENTNNFRRLWTNALTRIDNAVFKPRRDATFLIFIKNTVPLYCSEEFNSTMCRELIGRAIYSNWLHLDDIQYHENEQNVIDIHRKSNSLDYKFVSYVRNEEQKVIKRVNLTRDWAASVKLHTEMCGKGKDYQTCVIGHTSRQQFWNPINSKAPAVKMNEVWELLGTWFQEKGGLFKEQPKTFDEAGMFLRTKADWEGYLKTETEKLQGLYKGPGQVLIHHYRWRVTAFHKSSRQMRSVYDSRHWNMKEAVRRMAAAVYNNIIKPERDEAYLFFVTESTAFHCSEGALDTEICQLMLGWSLFKNHLQPRTSVLFNPQLPGNHPDAKFVAYLREKESKNVVLVNLTRDYGKSSQQYKDLTQDNRAKYVAGIIGHSQRPGWWLPYSILIGDLKNEDVYVVLAEYCQKTLKVHKDSGIDEKAANVTTRKAQEAKWKAAFDEIKGLYKGKGERLHKRHTAFTALYNVHTHQMKHAYSSSHQTLKLLFDSHTRWIYNHIIKRTNSPFEYIIGMSTSRAILFCSDGKPTESITCQRLIGFAIARNYIREGDNYVWETHNSKRLYNRNVAASSDLFEYYAIVMDHRKDGSPIKKVVLGNAAQSREALATYKTLFAGGSSSEATVGVFLDSKNGGIDRYRMTRYTGVHKYLDTYEMVAKYCQTELKAYDTEAADEKAALVKTMDEFNTYLKESNSKLRDLYKGTGELLARRHVFTVERYNKINYSRGHLHSITSQNMKHALNSLFSVIYSYKYRREIEDDAFLIYVRDAGVLHCSEDDLKSPICRRMIGDALKTQRLYAPIKAVDPTIPASSADHRFRAILKTAKGEISIFNLTKNRAESQKQYFNYFKNEKDPEKRFVSGIMGCTYANTYWYPVSKYVYRHVKNGAELWKGAMNNMDGIDVVELLAEAMQTKFDAFKEGAKDEKSAKLQTLKELREKQEAALKKFKSIWKGTGDQLQKPVWMFILRKDRRSRRVDWYGANRYKTNLQQQFAWLCQETFKHVIKPNRDVMLMVNMIQYGPMWCSEGELTDDECRKMIGQAIKHGNGWLDVSFQPKALDKYIPSNDLDYQYLAFVENTETKKVAMVNLTNNWGYATQAYNQLFQGGKDRQYNVGVIAHSARAGFWHPKSLLTGHERFQDSYAVYVKYWQKEKELWTKSDVSEKTCGKQTKKDYDEEMAKKWGKLKELFTGSGDQLFKNYMFVAVTYHKRARYLSQIYMSNQNNLKKAFDGLITATQRRINQPQHEMAYLYLARETIPFHCSEGKMDDQLCQRMIGFALYKNWLYADKKMTDRYINSGSTKYHYVAYLREKDGGKIIKQALVKDQGKSKSRLDAIVGQFKKYDAGVMGHTAIMGKWVYPISQLKGSHKNFDVYELIAKFCQEEHKLYKDSAYDEKGIHLVTQKQILEKQQKALKKLQGLYKGDGARLYKSYYWFAVSYNRRTKRINMEVGFHAWNMKNAMNRLTKAIFDNIIKRNADKAFSFHVQTNGPFYCSEGDLTKTICQRMIGYAITTRWQFGDHKMYNLMISSKDVDYQYVAYLRKHPKDPKDEKDKGELVKMNLTKNWNQATKRYNSLWKGKELEYQTGVISHTQRQQFWAYKTHLTGNLKNHDVYEMLADYTQTQGSKNFTKDGAKEETIKLKTKKEWDEHLKKEFEKLKDLNKASTDTLFLHYHFVAMVYGRQSHVISQRHYARYWNMKQAMQNLGQAIYNQVVKQEKDEAYLFLVRETTAFHCSEGDLDKKLCQRMIGHAITSNWLIPEKKMINKYLSSASRHYRHVAYLQDSKGEVVRLNLTKNYATSLAQFHAFVDSDDSSYVAGIIGHSAQNKWWAKHSQLRGSEKYHDCLEIIVTYAQKKLELYKDSGTDEKAAKVLVREKMEEKHKSALKKMRELYSGKGEKLYRQYVFYAVTYDKNTHRFGQTARSGHYTMKAAMNVLVTNIYNAYVSKHKEVAYMFLSYETVPFYCSEGKLDTLLCQRMIGHALRSNWQRADKKMIDPLMSTLDLDYQYVAYVKDDRKEGSEVKKVNLTNNWSAAVARYNQLVKGNTAEYTVGIMSNTRDQNWWYPYTQKTGNLKFTDVDQILAEYCQKKLEVWKDDGCDEKTAKLQTKKDYDDKLKEADKKLKALFTGSGDTLHQKYTFTIIFKHKRSYKFSVPFQVKLWSYKNAMIKMTQYVFRHVHKAEQDFSFLFSCKETVPLYCSEEGDKDFKKEECQQMIGWAIFNRYLNPPKKMVDKHITGARSLFIAYLVEKDGDKVVVKNLTANINSAKKVFLSLFQGEEQLYKAGCIGHTARADQWHEPVSARKGAEKYLDTWEAIARYGQTELKLFSEHAMDEKAAKLITKKMILERQQKALKKLNDVWKGTGDQLWAVTRFALATYDRNTKGYWQYRSHSRSLKAMFDIYVRWIFQNVIKPNRDQAWLMIVEQTGAPVFCSGDMKGPECRRMLGYLAGWTPMIMPSEKVFAWREEQPVTKKYDVNTKYGYIAVMKDLSKEEPKLEVVPMNTSVLAAAFDKYKEMIDFKNRDNMKIGFITHSSLIKEIHHIKSQLHRSPLLQQKQHDILELFGEYMQSKDDKYEKPEPSEKAMGLTTKKDFMDDVKKDFDKLSGLYTGKGVQLYLQETFFMVHIWRNRKVVQTWVQHSKNMKAIYQSYTHHIHRNWLMTKTIKDYSYMLVGRENTALHCSEGEFSKQECRIMLGFQIYNRNMFPHRKMVDPSLHGHDIRASYFGLFRAKKDGKIVRFNFTKHQGESIRAYEALWKSREYETGVMAHSRNRWIARPHSKINTRLAPKQNNWDVYEMIAEYAQTFDEKLKGEGAKDEKAAGYKTVQDINEEREACKKKIREIYKGQGERLARPSTLSVIIHNKNTQRLEKIYWASRWTQKEHYHYMGDSVCNYIFRNDHVLRKETEDIAWLATDRRYGPQQCSEKEFTNKHCRIMLGFALRHNYAFPPKSVTDIRLPGNSELYHWVGYAWNYLKPDSKVFRVDLGKQKGAADQWVKKMVTGADRNYTSAIIAHTGRRGFWNIEKYLRGGYADSQDVYEMLGIWYQEEAKVWREPCTDEKSCKVPTKKEYDAKLLKRVNTILRAYTGKNDRLYKNYMFYGVKYQKSSNMTTRFFQRNHHFLRDVWQAHFVHHVRSQILAPPTNRGDEFSWMLISRETGPLFCSDNTTFSDSIECTRMIGHAIQHKYLWPDKKVTNVKLSASDVKSVYIAIVRKDLKADPERIELDRGLEAAKQKFKALLKQGGPDQKYELGIMGHSSNWKFGWQFPTSTPKQTRSKQQVINDIEEMLAAYHHKVVKTYDKELHDEKEAKLKTVVEMNAEARAKQERVLGFYKGSGEQLHRPYEFLASVYNKETRAITLEERFRTTNIKYAFNRIANKLHSKFFRHHKEIAYLIYNRDRGVMACSEDKKMDSPICRTLLGRAMWLGHFRFEFIPGGASYIPDVYGNARDPRNGYYYALTADIKKLDEPKVTNLSAEDSAARKKFNELCPADFKQRAPERTVCVLATTFDLSFNRGDRTTLVGAESRHDVYQLIAKQVIDKVKSFGEFKSDFKALKIKTRVEWASMLKEKLEGMQKKFKFDAKERAHKPRRFLLLATHKTKLWAMRLHEHRTTNLRWAFDDLAKKAMHRYYNDRQSHSTGWAEDGKQRYAWAIFSDNGLIYSSEPATDVNTQRMIGEAIISNYMDRIEPLHNKMLESNSDDYHWQALVADKDDEYQVLPLSKNKNEARSQFFGMFPKGRENDWKYKIGLFGHTNQKGGYNNRWCKTTHPEKTIYHWSDCLLLPAKVLQKKFSKFLEFKDDVEKLDIETKSQVIARDKESMEKARQFWTKIPSKRLQNNIYSFSAAILRVRDLYTASFGSHRGRMDLAVQRLYTQVHNRWIRNQGKADQSYFIIFGERYDSGIVYSNLDDLKSEHARMLIGYSLQQNRIALPKKLTNVDMANTLAKTSGYHILAIPVGGKKPAEHIFTRDVSTFNIQRDKIKNDKEYEGGYYWQSGVPNSRVILFKHDGRKRGNLRFKNLWIQMTAWLQSEGHFTETKKTPEALGYRLFEQNNKERDTLDKKIAASWTSTTNHGEFRLVKQQAMCMYSIFNGKIEMTSYVQRANTIKEGIVFIARQGTHRIYAPNFMWGYDRPFIITSRDGEIVYSSRGDDLTKDPQIQRLIGYAFERPACLSPPANNRALKTVGVLDAPQDGPRIFMALVDDGKKVSRVNFTANQASSIKEFKNVVGEGKKYKSGLLLLNHWRRYNPAAVHAQLQVFARGSSGEFENLGMDVHETVARYLQGLGLYKKATHNEKDANLLTIAERDRRRKAEVDRIQKITAKVPTLELFRQYNFVSVFLRHSDGNIWAHRSNQKSTARWFETFNYWAKQQVHRDQPFTMVSTSHLAGCLVTTDEKGWETPTTQRAIGFAIRNNMLQYAVFNQKDKMYWDHNTPDHQARFFAIVKNLKTDEIKKYNLTMKDQGKSNQQFTELTKEKHMIGAFGFDGINPRWVRHVSRTSRNADVDLMLGQFAQRRYGRCKKSEPETYITKAQRDEAVSQKVKAFRQKHEQNKKFVADLRAHRAKYPTLRNRFPRPVYFSVYSFRPGNKFRGTTAFWRVNYAAWSYADILNKAANRIQRLVNWEKNILSNKERVMKNWRNRAADFTRAPFTHMAVLGSGAPRILWSSSGDIKNCKYGQALLGYIFRNSDPTGSPKPFWRENRKNFLRFHAWKWTQTVAMTKDFSDYHKAFSVYEDRATGKFTVNLCAGTESHKPAGAIAAAQKECVATFTKETNPVRSKKNVRGFFVSGTQFIFSKHEETPDYDEMNNGEVPAYGALGRWILQTLPKKDTNAKIQGSLAASQGDIFKVEGLWNQKVANFWIASHVDDMIKGKRVEVRKQRGRALGQVEWRMMYREDWWLARSEGPFVPVPQTAGVIFVEDKNEWYPLAVNNAETDLSSRPAVTALGSLLADKRLHGNGNKPRNLFEKCKPQTNFNGKITTIYELWTSDTIREVCEWCTQQYAETAAELLKQRPGLRKANKNRKQLQFDKAYAAKFKEEIKTRSAKGEYKFGATLLNKKHEFITIAEGSENPSDVYFALGKYARENCRTLQALADPRKAGFKGQPRRTG